MAVIIDHLEPFGTHDIGHVLRNEIQGRQPLFTFTGSDGFPGVQGDRVDETENYCDGPEVCLKVGNCLFRVFSSRPGIFNVPALETTDLADLTVVAELEQKWLRGGGHFFRDANEDFLEFILELRDPPAAHAGRQ